MPALLQLLDLFVRQLLVVVIVLIALSLLACIAAGFLGFLEPAHKTAQQGLFPAILLAAQFRALAISLGRLLLTRENSQFSPAFWL